MLTCEPDPVSIEGGGRVLIAADNGSFNVPADADDGLIHVGFDQDFNVTQIIYPNGKTARPDEAVRARFCAAALN